MEAVDGQAEEAQEGVDQLVEEVAVAEGQEEEGQEAALQASVGQMLNVLAVLLIAPSLATVAQSQATLTEGPAHQQIQMQESVTRTKSVLIGLHTAQSLVFAKRQHSMAQEGRVGEVGVEEDAVKNKI